MNGQEPLQAIDRARAFLGEPREPLSDTYKVCTFQCASLRMGSGQGSEEPPKHGISFEEAVTAFSDDEALLLDDPDHSTEEERFILLGLSGALRLLTVVHCYRDEDEVIHLISARRATRSERVQYGARWMQ